MKINKINWLYFTFRFLFIIFISVNLYFLSTNEIEPSPFSQPLNEKSINRIIFLSDTQDPLWIETLFLEENKNKEAQQRIFEEIISNNPSTVFHLGDMVALGFWYKDWKVIDHFTNDLKNNAIQFYPIIGNHEIIFYEIAGLANFYKRFPFISMEGNVVIKDNTAVVLLNSNFGILSHDSDSTQLAWYKSKLIELDNNYYVDFIIVGTHHSPYTNNKIVGFNEEVQEKFVNPFLESKKSVLFLSGHSHAFEHFKFKNKDFLVMGGGGGIQQPLYKGDEEKFKDLFDSVSTIRRFHFLQIEYDSTSLSAKLIMLDEQFQKFHLTYSLEFRVD